MPLELSTYLPPITFSAQADEDDLGGLLGQAVWGIECHDGRQFEAVIHAIVYDDDLRCPPGEAALILGTEPESAIPLSQVARFVVV